MELGRSKEEYLEAVYILSVKKGRTVRNVDLAEELNVKKSSVCRAVKLLEELGYLTKGMDFSFCLTSKGKNLGERMYERHRFWKELLRKAGVSECTTIKDAKEMKHMLTDESFEKIKIYMNGLK